MLPFCDRVVRSKYLPSRNRGIPVPKEPTTLGGHLRKRRLQLKLFQAEAARKLEVSTVTLSRWESDRLHPTWPYWPRIVAYLGYDPFANPALGRPKGNETLGVAFLTHHPTATLGQRILGFRFQQRKTRKQLAQELGISVKTLWGWETNRHQPNRSLSLQITQFLGIDPLV